MTNYEKIVIKELLSSLKDLEFKSLYSFHSKYNILPLDLLNALSYMISINIVEVVDNKIRLKVITDSDFLSLREYFINNAPSLLMEESEYSVDRIEINQPYTPNIEMIDKKYFKLVVDIKS